MNKVVRLKHIKTWTQHVTSLKSSIQSHPPKYPIDNEINSKISLWEGDITQLHVDAIVNAAKESLLGGGGVDGAIHDAAGLDLKKACKEVGPCKPGSAKITGGFKLPSKFVIHTVGPVDGNDRVLINAYQSSLNLAFENKLASIAFPCIATGIYNFPDLPAAHIASGSVREFIDKNKKLAMLQDALHFKPLQAQQVPVDETTDIATNADRAITKRPDKSSTNSLPFKSISLKDYESQRRMVEEQNKQKKEILYRAIEQHSERTAAEAKKLQEIRKELNKLESELAADVSVLRKQIEDASVKFMNAEKNYEQIETAFLTAKSNLFKAREKKELLVEHLSIIISNNEDRKAKKLSELMEKVGLTPLGERAPEMVGGTTEEEMKNGI